jgi:hypothetical protein
MNKNFLLKKTISNIHTIIKILIYFLFMNIAHADKWSDKFPHIEKTGDVPGKCSYEATSKKNYNNKVLRINTDVGPAIGGRTILNSLKNLLAQNLKLRRLTLAISIHKLKITFKVAKQFMILCLVLLIFQLIGPNILNLCQHDT